MKLVLDTNVAVSGLLWPGNSNFLLKQIRDKKHSLLLSDSVISELQKVLRYPKFNSRIKGLKTTPAEVAVYYQNLGRFIAIIKKAKVRLKDPGDKMFLDLALNGSPHLIVSGDAHLLALGQFNNIPVVMPAEAVQVLAQLRGD